MREPCARTGYPSQDKPWLKYHSEEAFPAQIAQCTVYENVYRHNCDHLTDIALEYFGVKISYGALFAQVERCAKALLACGVRRGQPVNLCATGTPEAVTLVLACSKIGALANFINPLFEAQQIIDRINDTGTALLFVLDKMHHFVANVVAHTCTKQVVVIPATASLPPVMRGLAALKEKPDAQLKTLLQTESYITWSAFLKRGEGYEGTTSTPYSKDMPVVMVYSSGTTGASKGIMLTNDGINTSILQDTYNTSMLARQNTFLTIAPFWLSTGVVICLLVPLCHGMTVILEPIASEKTFLNGLLKYKPNFALVTTSFWLYVMQHTPDKSVDLSHLIYVVSGGEQLLVDTEQQLNRFFKAHHSQARLSAGWGMCELGSGVTSTNFFVLRNRGDFVPPNSTGIPFPFVTVAAFDGDQEQPYGQRGELRVVSPTCMLGYYRNPAATDAFFHTDAQGRKWGCTGDIGYVDEQGFVYVLGRANDSYIDPDGETVYLFDTERVLLANKNVALCEVVAITDANEQTHLVAHIVPEESYQGDNADLIRNLDAACRAGLKPSAVPQAYKIRKSFIAHPNGKRDISALKAEQDGFLNSQGEPISEIY